MKNTLKTMTEKHLLGTAFEKPIVLVTYEGNVAIQDEVKVLKFDLKVDKGRMIHKLDVLFAFPLNQFEQIKAGILLKEDIAKKKLKPIHKRKERPKVATGEQYQNGTGTAVNVTLRTRHRLSGQQIAATQYNLILTICDQHVLIYKHGILEYHVDVD